MFASKFLRGGVWYLKWKDVAGLHSKSLDSSSARRADSALRVLRGFLAQGVACDVVDGQIVPTTSGVRWKDLQLSQSDSTAESHHGVGQKNATGLAGELTVSALADAWVEWCVSYYRKSDGSATGELDACRAAVVPLKTLYGPSPARVFGPVALKDVRGEMIARGWVRSTVNRQCGRLKRCFRWGVENELVPAHVLEGLRAVAGLRRGRTAAKEPDAVLPVPDVDIEAVLAMTSRPIAAMIRLQMLSGARPGEIVTLRAGDIDRSGKVWIAMVSEHKTAHHGKARALYFGPRAQAVLQPFLSRASSTEFLFSPRDAERVSPRIVGRLRAPGMRYSVSSYRRAIEYACKRIVEAEIKKKFGSDEAKKLRNRTEAVLSQLGISFRTWSPNQLRHNAATEFRREFGLDVAQVLLGHARADVTQVYAEVNRVKAMSAIEKVG